MAITRFKQIKSADYELMKVQDNVNSALIPVLTAQIIDGQVLKGITLVSGVDNTVNHRLGRDLVGYIVIRKNANAAVWDSTSATPALTLILQTSVNCTVDLYVF